jgi:hypothetical protein
MGSPRLEASSDRLIRGGRSSAADYTVNLMELATNAMMPTIVRSSRRQWLKSAGCGFGSVALAGLMSETEASGARLAQARAKRVIFLFMQGGPSQVDTFDYKPLLRERDGQPYDFHDARTIANSGQFKPSSQRVFGSPWKFAQHGQTGHWVSELFPAMAQHVDSLCFIHSMHTDGVAHGPATLFLHCGATNAVRPSMGSWILYGLGSENQNLPGFVSIQPSGGNGGARNYGSAFLPPVFQGTAIGRAGAPIEQAKIGNLANPRRTESEQRAQFELLRAMHHEQLARHPGDAQVEAQVASFELAWRMQQHAPEALDLSQESEETLALYGIGMAETDGFGRQCLMARRMAAAGVRYIQLTYGDNSANPAWDQHSNLPQHAQHAKAVDQPIAGLLTDLQRHGLWEDTLVWWGAEFGRTPYAEKNGTGRDHNPGGFTMWLAGGGTKAGHSHGETDDWGHRAIRDKVHLHDLHATILYLLGLDHERLTFRHDGREYRLTDVHGRVVHELLA